MLVFPPLTTPLLKVPLLITYSICNYQGMTPPHGTKAAPLKKTGKEGNNGSDFLTKTFHIQRTLSLIEKVSSTHS